jgi:D-allulose-6-phosphate 3-epimerase
VDILTNMTVAPSFTGQEFIEEGLEKIKFLKKYREDNNLIYDIQIDGSCNGKTHRQLKEAGADIFILEQADYLD